MAQVEGTVEPGFEGVRDAFAKNFEDHGEVGAAFALHVDGKKVVFDKLRAPIEDQTRDLHVGWCAGARFFFGAIDELMVWKRNLSDSELDVLSQAKSQTRP